MSGFGFSGKKDKPDSIAFFFQDKNIDPALAKELTEVRRILRLNLDRSVFRVVFGATASNSDEIAIQSRSVFRVLSELSALVDVPGEHLASGLAVPIGEQGSDERGAVPCL